MRVVPVGCIRSSSSALMPSDIQGLHHTAYRCKDVEETRQFYEDFLGLPLVRRQTSIACAALANSLARIDHCHTLSACACVCVCVCVCVWCVRACC